MSIGLNIYAERAFLSFVKQSLKHFPNDTEAFEGEQISLSSMCVLACAAALETIVNHLFEKDGRLKHYDEFRMSSKIDTLAELGMAQIAWGNQPWQDITRLIKIRNWLTHNKVSHLGTITMDGLFHTTSYQPIKWNPLDDLTPDAVQKFYDAVRTAGVILSEGLGFHIEYEYLQHEDYKHPVAAG